MATLGELKTLREEYKAAVAKAKIAVQPEFDAKVAEIAEPELVALSRAVHELHASGVAKATINSAMGVHSNVYLSQPIWDAYTPGTQTDLRKKASDVPALSDPVVQPGDNEGDYLVTFEGVTWLFWDVVWDSETQTVTFEFEEGHEEVYRFGWKALIEHFKTKEAGDEDSRGGS